MNETVKLIGATIVVIVCIGIVVYLILRKPSEEYLAKQKQLEEAQALEAQKRRLDITTIHLNDILWMAILSYGFALLVAIPLILWTTVSTITATIVHIGIMGFIQLAFHIWHHNHRRAELALQGGDTTFSVEFQLLSTQEMLRSILSNLVGYVLIIGTFVFSTWTLHEGLSQIRFNATVDDWNSITGFIAENGDDFIFIYQVDDRNYIGTHQSFAKETLTKEEYDLGEDVTVFFDPDDPEEAVLDTETSSPILPLFVSGIIWTFPMTIIAAIITTTTRKLTPDKDNPLSEDLTSSEE